MSSFNVPPFGEIKIPGYSNKVERIVDKILGIYKYPKSCLTSFEFITMDYGFPTKKSIADKIVSKIFKREPVTYTGEWIGKGTHLTGRLRSTVPEIDRTLTAQHISRKILCSR